MDGRMDRWIGRKNWDQQFQVSLCWFSLPLWDTEGWWQPECAAQEVPRWPCRAPFSRLLICRLDCASAPPPLFPHTQLRRSPEPGLLGLLPGQLNHSGKKPLGLPRHGGLRKGVRMERKQYTPSPCARAQLPPPAPLRSVLYPAARGLFLKLTSLSHSKPFRRLPAPLG